MPDHYTRAYSLNHSYVVLDNNFPINNGRARVDRMWYMVVAYIGKEDITFEIMHTLLDKTTTWQNYGVCRWQSLTPQTFANLFNDQDGNPTSGLAKFSDSDNKFNWAENVHVIVENDRVLLKFSRKYVERQFNPGIGRRSGGVNLYTIGNTLPGILLGRMGDIIALMERYPIIKTIDAAKQAKTALNDLDESIWQIRTLWQEIDVSNRQRLIDNIVATQHDIEKCNKEYDDICAKAAHAMDVLSQKYGIDIYI
jgi:hypothetical protein